MFIMMLVAGNRGSVSGEQAHRCVAEQSFSQALPPHGHSQPGRASVHYEFRRLLGFQMLMQSSNVYTYLLAHPGRLTTCRQHAFSSVRVSSVQYIYALVLDIPVTATLDARAYLAWSLLGIILFFFDHYIQSSVHLYGSLRSFI